MNASLKIVGLQLSLTLLTACGTYQILDNAGTSNAGAVLTTESGMTLYTFDKDTDGVSACYDACAAKWPPYLTSDDAPVKTATLSKRKDGLGQWVVSGSPLYTWVGDKKPGDTTGDGVGGVWHTARVPANRIASSY